MKNKYLLFIGFLFAIVFSGCKPNVEKRIPGEWKTVKYELPDLDQFINSMSQGAPDSLKETLKEQMKQSIDEQYKETVFEFKGDNTLTVSDGTKWNWSYNDSLKEILIKNPEEELTFKVDEITNKKMTLTALLGSKDAPFSVTLHLIKQ